MSICYWIDSLPWWAFARRHQALALAKSIKLKNEIGVK